MGAGLGSDAAADDVLSVSLVCFLGALRRRLRFGLGGAFCSGLLCTSLLVISGFLFDVEPA